MRSVFRTLLLMILVSACTSSPKTTAQWTPVTGSPGSENQISDEELKTKCEARSFIACFVLGTRAMEQKKPQEAADYFQKNCEVNAHGYSCTMRGFIAKNDFGDLETALKYSDIGCRNMDAIGCYNQACYSCNKNDIAATLKYLDKAQAYGFEIKQETLKDPDLVCLKNNKEFKALVAKSKKIKKHIRTSMYHLYFPNYNLAMTLPRGFSSNWTSPLAFTDSSGAFVQLITDGRGIDEVYARVKERISKQDTETVDDVQKNTTREMPSQSRKNPLKNVSQKDSKDSSQNGFTSSQRATTNSTFADTFKESEINSYKSFIWINTEQLGQRSIKRITHFVGNKDYAVGAVGEYPVEFESMIGENVISSVAGLIFNPYDLPSLSELPYSLNLENSGFKFMGPDASSAYFAGEMIENGEKINFPRINITVVNFADKKSMKAHKKEKFCSDQEPNAGENASALPVKKISLLGMSGIACEVNYKIPEENKTFSVRTWALERKNKPHLLLIRSLDDGQKTHKQKIDQLLQSFRWKD